MASSMLGMPGMSGAAGSVSGGQSFSGDVGGGRANFSSGVTCCGGDILDDVCGDVFSRAYTFGGGVAFRSGDALTLDGGEHLISMRALLGVEELGVEERTIAAVLVMWCS